MKLIGDINSLLAISIIYDKRYSHSPYRTVAHINHFGKVGHNRTVGLVIFISFLNKIERTVGLLNRNALYCMRGLQSGI